MQNTSPSCLIAILCSICN